MPGEFRFTITVPSLEKAIKSIKSYDGKSRVRIENILLNATVRVQRGAQRRAPRHTGAMARKIKKRFSRTQLTGRVIAAVPYAHFVEFGAKGGVIKPKKKKALTVGAGRFVPIKIAGKVKLPARKAKPFMRPAFDEVAPSLEAELAKELEHVRGD